MIKYSLQPITLLVTSVALLFVSKAQAIVVFEDFASGDPSGAAIVGSQPIVGGTVWEGNSGGTLTYGQTSGGGSEATPYSMYTDGAARTIYAGFAGGAALGTGQVLTLSFNGLGFGGNWPNTNGYAGVSLFSGFTMLIPPVMLIAALLSKSSLVSLITLISGALMGPQRVFRTVGIPSCRPMPLSLMHMIQEHGHLPPVAGSICREPEWQTRLLMRFGLPMATAPTLI